MPSASTFNLKYSPAPGFEHPWNIEWNWTRESVGDREDSLMATASDPMAGTPPFEGMPVDITSDLFFGMIEAGLISRERPYYLWDGRIFEKMAKTVSHATTAVRVHEALRHRLPGGWLIWPEDPIQLDLKHAPLPDFTVARGPLDRFDREQRHPGPADVGLVVEIAASSLPKDLSERAEKFARALVPVYWVADVVGRRIIEHRSPEVAAGVGTYVGVRPYDRGASVCLFLDNREVDRIPVVEMLP